MPWLVEYVAAYEKDGRPGQTTAVPERRPVYEDSAHDLCWIHAEGEAVVLAGGGKEAAAMREVWEPRSPLPKVTYDGTTFWYDNKKEMTLDIDASTLTLASDPSEILFALTEVNNVWKWQFVKPQQGSHEQAGGSAVALLPTLREYYRLYYRPYYELYYADDDGAARCGGGPTGRSAVPIAWAA